MITSLFPQTIRRSPSNCTKQYILCLTSDCARCKLNTANIGYLASCNDSTKYYQCQKEENGQYTLRLMSCADCTMWDQTQLTCVKDPSRNDCNDNTGSTGVKERITNIGCKYSLSIEITK